MYLFKYLFMNVYKVPTESVRPVLIEILSYHANIQLLFCGECVTRVQYHHMI